MTPPRRYSKQLILRLFIASLATFALAFGLYLRFTRSVNQEIFPGLRGPLERTSVSLGSPTKWGDYSVGGNSRLAILLTEPDSAWLGLIHGLKIIGVPFLVTTDYQVALRHSIVLVYPVISGRTLPQKALSELGEFVRNGGTLLGVNVLGGGLEKVFGFARAEPTRLPIAMIFKGTYPFEQRLTEPYEKQVQINAATGSADRFGVYRYLEPAEPPLATYDDGTAAITYQRVGSGHAYAFGIDLGAFLLKGYNSRVEGGARSYVNQFEPSRDCLLRLLKFIYQRHQPDAVTLGTVPDGRDLAVILTHDVDYSYSLTNALQYAAYEKTQNISATYFIQTKYVRDWNDQAFFNQQSTPILTRLRDDGMELANHSVSHSRVFSKFPMGDGTESYPAYVPFVIDRDHAKGGTILGELRVPKFLIENLAGVQINSFRPGHLQYPYTLPEALEASGHRYSSTSTANEGLSHFPFRLNEGRGALRETSVYEFPVTIEDEVLPAIEQRSEAAIVLAKKIARYGGICVVLIHPNVVEPKLEFERRFVAGVRDFSRFSSIQQFGDWWRIRDQIKLDVTSQYAQRIVRIESDERIEGIAIEVPVSWRLAPEQPVGLSVKVLSERQGRYLLAAVHGVSNVYFSTK